MKDILIPFFGILAVLIVLGLLIRNGGPIVHFVMTAAVIIAIVYRFVAKRSVV